MAEANKLCRGLFSLEECFNTGEAAEEAVWLNDFNALIGSNPWSNKRVG